MMAIEVLSFLMAIGFVIKHFFQVINALVIGLICMIVFTAVFG